MTSATVTGAASGSAPRLTALTSLLDSTGVPKNVPGKPDTSATAPVGDPHVSFDLDGNRAVAILQVQDVLAGRERRRLQHDGAARAHAMRRRVLQRHLADVEHRLHRQVERCARRRHPHVRGGYRRRQDADAHHDALRAAEQHAHAANLQLGVHERVGGGRVAAARPRSPAPRLPRRADRSRPASGVTSWITATNDTQSSGVLVGGEAGRGTALAAGSMPEPRRVTRASAHRPAPVLLVPRRRSRPRGRPARTARLPRRRPAPSRRRPARTGPAPGRGRGRRPGAWSARVAVSGAAAAACTSIRRRAPSAATKEIADDRAWLAQANHSRSVIGGSAPELKWLWA